jgi:hypothetical protein
MAIPAHTIPPGKRAVIQLDDGELAFDKTTVMRPPAVRFSTDVNALFREWHQSTYLMVNGRGIPVKNWGDVYKQCTGENSKAWALRKVQWGQWKVSSRTLWSKFSMLNEALFLTAAVYCGGAVAFCIGQHILGSLD